ncbi:MAG: HEAT repeat domain-containing protein [Pseudomonadota bacterium]
MSSRMFRVAALSLALGFASQARAAELPLPRDGWASWQVEAVEDAPAWCCWSNGYDQTTSPVCQLDGDKHGYGSRDNAKTDAVRMYARFKDGKIERLRSLSASCPAQAETPIQQLDAVATDDSARWLIGLTKQTPAQPALRGDFAEDVLAALAMHRGTLAFDALSGLARNDVQVETRKHAIFWLAVMRGAAGADVVSAAMFNDKVADVRKHASFAITQSRSPRVAADLIRLGNSDLEGDVRSQAWFWLAHSGAPAAEEAIVAASKRDQDDNVREKAVFALSQLPDARATRALIAAAEDKSLSREQRKQAVFWLAQSKSTDAQLYLEKVLVGNTAR